MLILMLRIRDFLTGGGYPFAKNSDKAKGDAGSRDDAFSKGDALSKNDDNSKNVILSKYDSGSKNDSNSKNVDTSKNDVNSNNANIHKNDAVNNNVKDDNASNDSTDVKKSKVAVYKSAQSAKEVSKEDKAATESSSSGNQYIEVEHNESGTYDFTSDRDITNPFPNVITPEEVNELQSRVKSAFSPALPYLSKSFYTPAGKKLNIVNGEAAGDTKELDYAVPIQFHNTKNAFHVIKKSYNRKRNSYHDMPGRFDTYIFIAQSKGDRVGHGDIKPYESYREAKNEDGSLSLDTNREHATMVPYTLEINGKHIIKNLTEEIDIQYYMDTNQNFIHMITYARKSDETIYSQYLRFNYETSASGFLASFVFMPECGAQFHFVDDLQYRNVAHINDAGKLSQRSAGETDRFSTKPFKKLDLPDLQDSNNVSKVLFVNNALGKYIVPILTFNDDPKDYIERPTMEGLTGTKIPGYLYYSNDIDTPSDGEFTADNTEDFGNYDCGIVRDKDDNQVTTKHYYVTFRPIPTQLVVQYRVSPKKIESGKPFELYVGEKKDNKKVNYGFKSSVAGTAPGLSALETMIKDPNTSLLPEAAGYFSGDNVYLAPGNYIVKPTAEAPENYEWVVDSTDIANAPTDKNINIAVHATDDVSTQQVVTFVLRRKIATVTFFDGDDNKPYATVKVQKGSSIDGDELKNQSMPKDPTKSGFTFNGWFTGKDGNGTKFTGNTTVSGNISVHSSYISNPPAPTPEPEPEPTPEPEPDIDWDDIPDIDLTPDKEPEPVPTPTPVPDFPVPVAPAPILPPAEAEPEPAPAPSQPEQPKQPEQQPKHVAKHLPKTGSTATPILASAIASLFAGLAGLAESFAATRKRRN